MEVTGLSDAQRERIFAISKDFYRYARGNLFIRDKNARIIRFVPNIAQRALIDRVLYLLENKLPVRIMVLKARQMGLSTAIEALIY